MTKHFSTLKILWSFPLKGDYNKFVKHRIYYLVSLFTFYYYFSPEFSVPIVPLPSFWSPPVEPNQPKPYLIQSVLLLRMQTLTWTLLNYQKACWLVLTVSLTQHRITWKESDEKFSGSPWHRGMSVGIIGIPRRCGWCHSLDREPWTSLREEEASW